MSVAVVSTPRPWAEAVHPEDRVRLEEAWEHVERALVLLGGRLTELGPGIDLRRYRDQAFKAAVDEARDKVGAAYAALERIDAGLPA